MIFNLKQDNFQDFLKNPKSGTLFCCIWDRICFFNGFYCVLCSMPVCTVYIYCHILLTNLRQEVFFSFSSFYHILGLTLPDKQFFNSVNFLIVYKTLVYKFTWSSNSLIHHTVKRLKKSIFMLINSSMIILMSCSIRFFRELFHRNSFAFSLPWYKL